MDSNSISFSDVVHKVFQSWNAFQIAVEQRSAGRKTDEIANWMPGAIAEYFDKNEDLMSDEVEDLLAYMLDEDLNIHVCDGSLTEVSHLLCQTYEWHKGGNFLKISEELQKLPSSSPSNVTVVEEEDPLQVGVDIVSSVVNGVDSESSESDSEENELQSRLVAHLEAERETDSQPSTSDDQTLQMEMDGFTLVRRKGKKK